MHKQNNIILMRFFKNIVLIPFRFEKINKTINNKYITT